MQHSVDLLGQFVQAPGVQAQARAFDVGRHRGHAAGMGVGVTERGGQHRAQALVGIGVVPGADQREHVPPAALQKARHHLHAHETRRAGDQDRLVLRPRIGPGRDAHIERPYASGRRWRPAPGSKAGLEWPGWTLESARRRHHAKCRRAGSRGTPAAGGMRRCGRRSRRRAAAQTPARWRLINELGLKGSVHHPGRLKAVT